MNPHFVQTQNGSAEDDEPKSDEDVNTFENAQGRTSDEISLRIGDDAHKPKTWKEGIQLSSCVERKRRKGEEMEGMKERRQRFIGLLSGDTVSTLKRLPWKIVPFVIGMFIMVQALNVTGWIAIFAVGMTSFAFVCCRSFRLLFVFFSCG